MILSLVQQLSFEANTNLPIKAQWIVEGLTAIDQSDPVISSHVPRVYQQVSYLYINKKTAHSIFCCICYFL